MPVRTPIANHVPHVIFTWDEEKLNLKPKQVEQELASALEEAVREPGPYLLNVRVSPNENVYPMIPAGCAINEMVLGPPEPVGVAK